MPPPENHNYGLRLRPPPEQPNFQPPPEKPNFQLRLRAFGPSRGLGGASTSNNNQREEEIVNCTDSWRQKMKRHMPQLYDAQRNHDAASARLRRLEKKIEMDLPENIDLKNAEKAKRNRRMREYRAKKKLELEELAEGMQTAEKKEKKRMTRAETEKGESRKARDAARQRLKRLKLSARERKAVNQKRREKRGKERQELEYLLREKEEFEARKAEELESLQQEEKRLMEEWTNLQEEREVATSSSVERKRLSRARKSISNDPIIYASTVTSLIDKASPRKRKLLDMPNSGERSWATCVGDGLASEIASLHKSRKKEDLKRKRVMAATVKIAKKYRLQKKVCKAFRISHKALQMRKAKSHKRKVSPSTQKAVHHYYERYSIVLPDKRYVSKKTHQPARFLTVPISAVYCSFRKENPTIQIGVSKFTAMRPPHIKLRSAIKYRGCLCEYCANIELKVDAINRFAHQHQVASPFSSVYNLNSRTMCSRGDNRHNKLECIQRKCAECGVHKITLHVAALLENDAQATWKKWERETKLHNGKTTSKMVLNEKQTPISNLINELEVGARPFAQHLFSAAWQNAQYAGIAKNPPPGCVVMVYDFAENYSCRYQDEIQSVHWGHEAATLHPIVASYRCPEEECEHTMAHSLVMISQDNTHDHHAVHRFTEVALDHLKTKVPNMSRIIRFSDGAPSQYKSRGPFMDVSYAASDYGVQFQHNFFGSRHGKGPSDGESGVIKRMVTDAVMAGTAVVRDAKDMYEFVAEKATRPAQEVAGTCCHFRRDVFWVDSADIIRNRDRQATKTVVGTRLIHSVQSVKPKVIATRSLSCFCHPCVEDRGDCLNAMYVEPYTNVALERGVATEPLHRSDDVPQVSDNCGDTSVEQSVSQAQGVATETVQGSDADGIPAASDNCSGTSVEPLVPQAEEVLTETVPRSDAVPEASNKCSEASVEQPAPQAQGDNTETVQGLGTAEVLEPEGNRNSRDAGSVAAPVEVSQRSEVVTDKVQISLSTGDFAAVQFHRTIRKKTEVVIYMAAILDIDQDSVVLKFMERKSIVPPDYIWPDIERSFTHPKHDVICTVTPPEVEYRNRSAVYSFKETDLQKIQGYFPGQELIFK